MESQAFCPYPFNRVRVTSEGKVAMCCYQRADPALPNDDPYIGDLTKNSFDEIWFGDIAEDIRKETIAGNLHKKCQCPGCPFLSMNKPYPKQNFIYNEYPTFLEIDLPNTHCNVGLTNPNESHPACIMCERAAPWFKPEENKLKEVLNKISPLMPNLQQIHIQGLAEPFWKGLIFEVLDDLNFDDYKYKCIVSVNTNGTIFNQKCRSEYLNRCPNSITTFSIDAATPETYKKIRILPLFDKVLENFYAFSKEIVRSRQFLRVNNNINLINIDEAVSMVKIAANANVNCLEFNPTDGFNREILVNESNCGKFYKTEEEIKAECNRLKVPFTFTRPLDTNLTSKLFQITL